MRHLGLALSVLAVLCLGLTAEARKHKKKKKKTHHAVMAKPATSGQRRVGRLMTKSGAADMDIALEVDGAMISHPHVAVVLGEKGTITQNMPDHSMYVIEVTPKKRDAHSVETDFAISKVANGKTTLIGKPRISSLLGEQSRIEQRDADGKGIALTVTTKL